MSAHDSYLEYLQQRSGLALRYRNSWLYPRLCRHLQGRVLDVGCGIGDMMRFRPNTVGVDINPKIVEYCRSRGLDAHPMESDRLPFPDRSFGGVTLDNVIEHIEQPFPLLAEIRRVLAPNGTLIVGVPGKRGYASDPDHKKFYPESTLNDCLTQAGYKQVSVLHMPFHSPFLDRYLSAYAIYGVFTRSE